MGRAPCLFTAALAILICLAPADAAESSLQQKTDQARSALENTLKHEEKAQGVLDSTQKDLEEIEARLDDIAAQILTIRARSSETSREITATEAELASLQDKLDDVRAILRQRVNLFYRFGSFGLFEFIFSATDFADLINLYELSGYYLRRDLSAVKTYQIVHEEVESRRSRLVQYKAELEQQLHQISNLQASAKREEDKADERVSQAQRELDKIQNDRQRLELELGEWERLSNKLGDEVRNKGAKAALGTGKLIWPVTGRISSPFGWRLHPVLNKQQFHQGIDIAVPSGTRVMAADSGVVIISGWRGDYGYLVAIDHGGGYSTFYAHNQELLVKEGDVVAKGSFISISDSTGLSTGPHLHFEVRKNGDPVDPLDYLPKR